MGAASCQLKKNQGKGDIEFLTVCTDGMAQNDTLRSLSTIALWL